MKAGFVTCVELGLACMRAIYDVGGSLAFALTLPDEKARMKSGRVYLDGFCAERGIRLHKVSNINDESALDALRREQADVLFIIGWSQIAGHSVLRSAGYVIGMHPTLLPEGRGRAAIPWAIFKGLPETGVTMFALDEGVDSGDILAQIRVPIADDENASSLYRRMTDAHAQLIRVSWSALADGTIERRPQDHSRATYWPARTAADGELNPRMTVREVDRLVRATTRPYPGAFLRETSGAVVRIWSGRIADEPQRAGERRLQFADGAYDAVEWKLEHPATQSARS